MSIVCNSNSFFVSLDFLLVVIVVKTINANYIDEIVLEIAMMPTPSGVQANKSE